MTGLYKSFLFTPKFKNQLLVFQKSLKGVCIGKIGGLKERVNSCTVGVNIVMLIDIVIV